MEPSNNYQTTVDTDTFHPREPDPEDVARVRARANESNLPERNSRALIADATDRRHPDPRAIRQVATGGEGLPAPDANTGENIPKLDVNSGGTIAMDAMGPVVGAPPSPSQPSPSPSPSSAGFGGHLFPLPARVPPSSV
jgi:hypothetical protein